MGTCHELASYARFPEGVVRAEGCDLVLESGRRVLDLYGGHCVNTLGAGDEALGRVLADGWRELSFVTNALEHPRRREFLDAWSAILPEGDWHVFASNSGAEANENAVKVAIAATGRHRVIAFQGSFHGRTAVAHALSDAHNRAYSAAPVDVLRLAFGDASQLRAIDDTVAAVIVEPIQSMAGVVTAEEGWLRALREACDAAGTVLIFDEVQTASGRTGEPFAAQSFGVVPDVITTAKGVAGGYPAGFTAAREEVAASVPKGYLGSTFGGGPLAFALAAEVARRIAAPGFLENVRATGEYLARTALRGPVQEVRGRGLLLGLVVQDGVEAPALRDALLERGVLVGTSNDPRVLRLMPPLVLTPELAQPFEEALLASEVTV